MGAGGREGLRQRPAADREQEPGERGRGDGEEEMAHVTC